MKLTNRLLTIGLGIGLCAMSTSAMAHSSSARDEHVSARRVFAQVDEDNDGRISFNELVAFEWAHARAEFARKDLNRDGLISARERAADDEDCEPTTVRPYLRRAQYRVPVVRVGWQQRFLETPYRQITFREMRADMIDAVKALFREVDANRDRHLTPAEIAQARGRETPSGVSLVRPLSFET